MLKLSYASTSLEITVDNPRSDSLIEFHGRNSSNQVYSGIIYFGSPSAIAFLNIGQVPLSGSINGNVITVDCTAWSVIEFSSLMGLS